MKVIDFGSGNSLLVRMNWRDNNPGGLRFISQSFLKDILGTSENREIHCYDSVAIMPEEIIPPLGDKSEILLHSHKRTLPNSVDMVCAFNPNPRVVFGTLDKLSNDTPRYDAYISELAHVVKVRLRLGGILAVQFDKSMLPPVQSDDGSVLFLRKIVPGNTSFALKGLQHKHQGDSVSSIEPFASGVSYQFSSLHIFQKVHKA